MSIENGNQAHEAQNDSYDAWQNMASEIRQESTTKNYSDARREGGLPEYIRDEQDYKEWRAEQDAKKSESLKKDQEIFDRVRNIEDPTDRDFATVCLGQLSEIKRIDDMGIVLEYINQDDKSGTLSEFVEAKGYLQNDNDLPYYREFEATDECINTVRQIEEIANNPEEHIEKIADTIESLEDIELDTHNLGQLTVGMARHLFFNPNRAIKNPEVIYLAEKRIDMLKTATDDIKKYEAAVGVNVALALLEGESFDDLKREAYKEAVYEYRRLRYDSRSNDGRLEVAPVYVIKMSEIEYVEGNLEGIRDNLMEYNMYLEEGKKLLETAAR